MASVSEIFKSRDGGVRGTYGSEGIHRLFQVITDRQTDDPAATIQTTSGGVRLGASHPWGAFGVVVIGFSQARLAPLLWEVEAIYGVPLSIDPERPWDVAIDTSLETYQEMKDLDGQVIGPAMYYPEPFLPDYTAATFAEKVKEIKDKRFYDTNGDLFYAATLKNAKQRLYPALGGKRRAVGIERTRSVATMRLSRTVPNVYDKWLASVMSMVNTVNSSTFYGAKPGNAKFVGMTSASAQGVIPGQAVVNVVWELSLHFAIDWDGHNPSSIFDVYQDEDGTDSTIVDDQGELVVRSYRLYDDTEFNTILSTLDG